MDPLVPLPNEPINPGERIYCDGNTFGEPITVAQVYDAARLSNLPAGSEEQIYDCESPSNPLHLPRTYTSTDGLVLIKLEVVGPPPEYMTLVPDHIRKAVGWIARECAGLDQIGGYATLRRGESVLGPAWIGGEWMAMRVALNLPRHSIAHVHLDVESSFLGISVTTASKDVREYGNAQPRVMSDVAHDVETAGLEMGDDFNQRVGQELYESVQMMTGHGGYWWDEVNFHHLRPANASLFAVDGLSCNASRFGKPEEKACLLISQQLPNGNVSLSSTPIVHRAGPRSRKSASDRLPLSTTANIRAGGCVAIVRSDAVVSVAWSAIKDAIDDILAVCLHSPMTAIAGGIMTASAVATGYNKMMLPGGVSVTLRSS